MEKLELQFADRKMRNAFKGWLRNNFFDTFCKSTDYEEAIQSGSPEIGIFDPSKPESKNVKYAEVD